MELTRARQHMARKEWVEARPVLETLAVQEPARGEIWHELGTVRFSMGDFQKAAQAFRQALACTPPCLAAYGTFAALLLQKGLEDAALLMLHAWVGMCPEDDVAQKTFADVLAARRRRGGGKLLFIMEEGIGNMVMATPALRALHEGGHIQVHVLGKRPALDVIDGWECVDRVLDRPGDDFYDLILLSIWSRSSWKTYGAGLVRNTARIIEVPRADLDRHEADYHLDLVAAAGLELHGRPAAHCQQSAATPGVVLPASGRPWVGLSNTALANGGWERKRWSRFRELAVELDRRGYQVLLFGGEHERQQFNPAGWPASLLDVQGRLTVQETAGLLSQCRLVIATDSGPAHIAAAVGVPTYVLFGSTRISKNKPVGRQVVAICKELPCSPCQYTDRWNPCTSWRCMSEISLEDVLCAMERDGLGTASCAKAAAPARPGKILLVGVLDVASSTNVFMKKGFEAHGCVVEAYNYRTRQAVLGSAEAMWQDFRRFLQGKRYDLILFCKVNSLHPDCVTFAKAFGPTWYWFMDNLGVARAIQAQAFAGAADFASATSAEVYDLFARHNPRSYAITEGYDPLTYFHEVQAKKHDVIFFGNATPQRVADLQVIQASIPVAVFGCGWPESFQAAPPVFNDDLRRLINQSRIVLNFVHSNIFSDRIILSAAAGGFVLTQYCPDLENHFQAGQHLDWFRTPQQAVEKIQHYLQQDEVRERIAQDGMALVQSRYAWPMVCQRILDTAHSGCRAATPAALCRG